MQRQVPGHGLCLSRCSSSCASPRRLLEEFLILGCSRCWHLEIWHIIPSRLCIWQSLPRSLGVAVVYRIWILRKMTLAVPQCLARRLVHALRRYLALDELHIFSTLPWTRILKCRVLSRCFSFSHGCAARTRKSGDPFTSPTWLEVAMM